MRAENKAPKTITTYLAAVETLATYLRSVGRDDLTTLDRNDLRRWIEHMQSKGASAATVSLRFRAVRQFVKWCAAEEEIATDVMAGMTAPAVPIVPVAVLSDDELSALLKACSGRDFMALRDTAIIRLLLDTGMRRGELLGLGVDDVDVMAGLVTVFGKGRRYRTLKYGSKTRAAMDRYKRRRCAHRLADLSAFWLPERGSVALSEDALRSILRRRGEAAGIGSIHTHQFRHTFAADYLDSGGNETDLMRAAGWRSRQMVDRYGAAVADDRARAARDRLVTKADRL